MVPVDLGNFLSPTLRQMRSMDQVFSNAMFPFDRSMSGVYALHYALYFNGATLLQRLFNVSHLDYSV